MQNADRPVTVITGGTRGIGAATAIRLARAGHDLALAYRQDASAAERAAARIEAARGPGGPGAPGPGACWPGRILHARTMWNGCSAPRPISLAW
jgi:NAD(P)-dependent dehydrogenase (short-subunit alcohol dehydrogenase family)